MKAIFLALNLLVFNIASAEGVRMDLPVVQSSDKLSQLIVHTSEETFGLNTYFPETEEWIKRSRAMQGRSIIEGANFIEDQQVLAEKISQDACLSRIAAQVYSGQLVKKLNDRLERQFETYAIEDGLVAEASRERGTDTIRWSLRGAVLTQAPKIQQLYQKAKNNKKFVVDYLRTGGQFNMKLHLVFPELEPLKYDKINHWPSRTIDIKSDLSSCRIHEDDLDALAWQLFLRLRADTRY